MNQTTVAILFGGESSDICVQLSEDKSTDSWNISAYYNE